MLVAAQTRILDAWFTENASYLSGVVLDVEEDPHFGADIWEDLAELSPGGGRQMLIDDINDYVRSLSAVNFARDGVRQNPELLVIENPDDLQRAADAKVKTAVESFAELLDQIKVEVSEMVGADVTDDPRMDAILQEMIPRMVKETDIMKIHAGRQQE